ncbi:MAG: SDR family oxidoreductase [Halioglobus sp.]|nr:SDR family oxidoreductase [Halioglobus sp.]
MKGKHVAITGPTAGIGRTTSLELAKKGAQLTLLCRSAEKARALGKEIVAAGGLAPHVIVVEMSSLDSVRTAGEQLLAQGKPLDVLLNNAGAINMSRRETVDGFEETLAVNHFAPFLLTGLLLPLLQQAAPGARIVNVASDAHTFVKGMGFDDMQATKNYKTFREYGRSKLANILFTRRLARQLQGQGITVNCLHPGAVATSLGTNNNGIFGKIVPRLLKPFFRTPMQGAETSIYLCSSDEVAGVTGEYFVDCKPRKPKSWGRDDAAADKLWRYTEDCLDYSFPL